jgi:hypothetical protein
MMKRRILLLAVPLTLGLILAAGFLIGLKQTPARAAVVAGPVEAWPRLPENAPGIFSPAAGWFSNKPWTTNAVVWVDIDTDGDLDLAMVTDDPYLLIYANTGDGIRYTPQQTITLPSPALAMAWGDVDGDVWLDVAIGMTDRVEVYTSVGGVVSSTQAWTANVADAKSVAWGDLGGDNDLDLAVVGCLAFDCRARVFENDGGALQITSAWEEAASGAPTSLAWGYLDDDDFLDLAVGYYNAPAQVYLYVDPALNATADWTAAAASFTSQVAWADLDRDGWSDLGVANDGQPSQVYMNIDGALETTPSWDTGFDDATTSLAWGDVDADGDPDLALGNDHTPTVLYLNEGGVLAADPAWTSVFRNDTRSLAWGDMDNDGDLDLLVGMNASQSRVMRNVQGTLEYLASVGWEQGTVSMTLQAWGDVNQDGWMDLAAFTLDGKVSLYQNDFGMVSTTPAVLSSDDMALDLTWADVNGDGSLDLTVAYLMALPRIFMNNGSGVLAPASWTPTQILTGTVLAYADADGDDDLDLAVAGFQSPDHEQVYLYLNNNGSLASSPTWSVTVDAVTDLAWGDFDRDGDPDLAIAREYTDPTVVYQNIGDADLLADTPYWQSPTTEPNVGVDWGDVDNDGDLDLAVFNLGAQSRIYLNNLGVIASTPTWESQETETFGGDLFDMDGDGDLDVMLYGYGLQIYINDRGFLWPTSSWSDTDIPYVDDANFVDLNADGRMDLAYSQDAEPPTLAVYINRAPGHPVRDIPLPDLRVDLTLARSGLTVMPEINQGVVPVQYQLFDPESVAVYQIRAYYSTDGGGAWKPAVAAAGTDVQNLTTSPYPTPTVQSTHIYYWDVPASGLFGRADNVVFRLEAVLDASEPEDGLPQTDGRRPLLTSASLPFRVRGTQIRVMNGAAPAADALVYRRVGAQLGAPIADLTKTPFHTDAQGYLLGRAELQAGDELLALAPQFISTTYTTYFTNGSVNAQGVNGQPVAPTATGVQTITVSAASPLILFDLTVSLEWDATQEPAYLEQLQTNLRRASTYLYDFTDGQVALGKITVYQNGDGWIDSHVTVYANNRMRPWAIEGGVVITTTADPMSPTLKYYMGQLSIGSIWNRYGLPGQSMGDDWPIILAHELSHYLLFQDDVYMGLDPTTGQIVQVMSCTGSAMGDVYDHPENTEFIFSSDHWNTNCGTTLANNLLRRTEWQTLVNWYPALVTPTVTITGPITMPFNFTTVAINAPITPTAVLVDPVFYVDYVGGATASSGGRAYLERNGLFLRNVGAPSGGQNFLRARGAQVGDRLCVFDAPRKQFGCETVSVGDNHLTLQKDLAWNPIVSLTPVNSTTLIINVSNAGDLGGTVFKARLFPQYQNGTSTLALAWTGAVYSGTFHLDDVAMTGMIQVWVDEGASEEDPRRETILPFSVGGNPGFARTPGGGGGFARTPGGGGGFARTPGGGGGFQRAGNAPLMSPDGAMIFFTKAETVFPTGTVFTIQAMAGVPELPPGRLLVGQAYNIIASPGVTMPVGSVSVQYLENDVTVTEGMAESDLRLYYYDGSAWHLLPTNLSPYYNLAAAPSQGPGIYALLVSIPIQLYGPGWNMFPFHVRQSQPVTVALGSIAGAYTTVYGWDAVAKQWLVYDTSHAKIFNSLQTLEYDTAYWINVSTTVTLYLSTLPAGSPLLPALPTGQPSPRLPDMPAPPALFYGVLQPAPGFTPQAGMLVQAYANGTLACGQGVAQAYQGQIVYSVIAWNINGCAVPGYAMTFKVNGQDMAQTSTWDNTFSHRLDLWPTWPGQQVFLPFVLRKK